MAGRESTNRGKESSVRANPRGKSFGAAQRVKMDRRGSRARNILMRWPATYNGGVNCAHVWESIKTKRRCGSESSGEWQRRSGRAIQFCGVTKLGCRNGAASWAECSGVPFGRAGCLGASQSFGLRRQASWLKVWLGGGCKFSATERAHKRNGGQIDAQWRLPRLVTIDGENWC